MPHPSDDRPGLPQSKPGDGHDSLSQIPDVTPPSTIEAVAVGGANDSPVGQPLYEAPTLLGPLAGGGAGEMLGAALPIGTVLPMGTRVRYFGDYELLAEIARGGMGVVYKARQVSLNRIVALKMILAGQLASEDDVKRFHAEAEAAASLDHPGIVPIYEVGEHEGLHYFSMGFVEGLSLAKRVADGPLPPREAAELLVQIAEAVQYAHDKGVIHRDLKPANILLQSRVPRGESPELESSRRPSSDSRPSTFDSRPKVTDFGLAKRVTGGSDLTNTGQVLGTPSYMPPEQAAGRLSEIGPVSDVYSLGAILYTLLVGRPPFQAASPLDTLLQVLEREPIAPRQLNAGVPRDLETIALKCLEKTSARRYGSAQALADDLKHWLNHEPIQARPSTVWERSIKWAKRRPVVAALSLFLAVSLLTGSVVSTLFGLAANREAGRANNEAKRANTEASNAIRERTKAIELSNANAALAEQEKSAREKADLNADAALRQTKLAERHLYAAHMNLAQSAWENAHVRQTVRLLDLYRPVVGEEGGPDDQRGFEWYYWDRLCHSYLLELKGHTDGVHSVTFSADGKRLASASHDRTVKVWDATNGQEKLTLKGHSGGVLSVAFSADGNRLASASDDQTVKVWDATSGQETLTLKGHTAGVTSVAFSPNGQRLASASSDQTVKVWDAATGQESLTLKGHTDLVISVAFSPDGQRLASASYDGTRRVWDATNGQETLTIKGLIGRASNVTFSVDGKRLASSLSADLKVWDAESGKETVTCQGRNGGVLNVAFNSAGTLLATANMDGYVTLWAASSGKELRKLKGHIASVNSVAFSPDGNRLASASWDNTVKVWNSRSDRTKMVLHGDSVAFSPDGKRLAAADRDRSIKVWDATTGQQVLTLKGHSDGVLAAVFSHDGQRLASASQDQTVKVWDAATGQESLTLDGHTDWVWSVAFNPDGKQLASASRDRTIRVWDATTGQETLTLKGHTAAVLTVAFRPDGMQFASGSEDQTVKIWDAITGQETLTFKGHTGGIWCVVFSADGRQLASASMDGTVKVWDVVTGQETLTLKGHTTVVQTVAFSPDGKRLASGSWERVVKVWDALTGQETLTIEGDTAGFRSLMFSPDGRRLASADNAGLVQVWDAIPRETPELLMSRVKTLMAYTGDAQLDIPAAVHKKSFIGNLSRAELLGEATRTADKLRKIEPVNFYNLYNAGCCFGLCLNRLAKMDVLDKDHLKAKLQTDAIECLKAAIAAGFKDAEHMAKDADIEALRELPEFQTLLKKLQPN